VISNPERRLLYVSKIWIGKEHDYAILKEEFDPALPWFKKFKVRLDSGFQGFQKDYEYGECYVPHKKTKNKELSPEQKNENQQAAKQRIRVEHAIAGLKRYRILSERARIRDFSLFDQIIGVCAGLWNYTIS
jgi:hypothetical protein